MASVKTVIAKLTPAERRAIMDAFPATHPELRGAWLLTGAVRIDVRRRLIEKGLLGRRIASGLTLLGRGVRDELLK